MHCPFCSHEETKVIDSRLAGEGRQIRRRRQCLDCNERFTTFESAELVIEPAPVRVRCNDCGAETEAAPNRLLCGDCGGWKTRLISGDELLLANLELTIPDG